MPTRQDDKGRWHAEACVGRSRLHRRLPEGATASDAKRVAAELTAQLHAAAADRSAKPPQQTSDPLLTTLLADYTERHAYTLRSPSTARYHALRIGKWCEGRRVSETRAVVAAATQDMAGHYKPATINRSLGALGKALRIAWQHGTVSADYSSLCKRLPEHNARTTWLTLAQVQTLASHASQPTQAAIWISVLSGCRRGEVLALRQDMIHGDTITLPAGATKIERSRSIPVIAALRPWLVHLPLPLNAEGLKSGFRRAREAAGMPHVTFHDLRRSCGTLLIQHGVPLHVVSRILGHSSTAVTERVYAHLSSAQLQAGMAVMNDLHRDLHQQSKAAPKGRVSA
jgi:integrase